MAAAGLDALFAEVSLGPPTAPAVLAQFPGTVVDFASLSEDEFNGLLDSVTTEGPLPEGAAAGAAPPQVPLTLLDRTRLRQARRRARLASGLLNPDVAPAAAASPDANAPPPSKKVKLSSLVDPSAEAELVPLSASALTAMFAKYEENRGGPPGVDVEPTLEQLSAVKQLVDAGAPPYVDFSLFGPYGKRFLKKLTYIETLFQVSSGTWVRRELPGPSSYEAWERSWAVFECAAILLDIITPEKLLAYQNRIRKFVTTYGPNAWPVIYQADVRMRSEQFERIRRKAEITRDPGLDRARPWDFVFHRAVNDHTYWAEEVQEKAVLLLARPTPLNRLLADGTISEGPPSYAGRQDDRGTGGPVRPQRAARRPAGEVRGELQEEDPLRAAQPRSRQAGWQGAQLRGQVPRDLQALQPGQVQGAVPQQAQARVR